jgi:hypothetical protein
MRHRLIRLPPHPVVRYGEIRGWSYAKTAKHFRIATKNACFRQIARGHVKVSFDRALGWANRSDGAFTAQDVMMWHIAAAKKWAKFNKARGKEPRKAA